MAVTFLLRIPIKRAKTVVQTFWRRGRSSKDFKRKKDPGKQACYQRTKVRRSEYDLSSGTTCKHDKRTGGREREEMETEREGGKGRGKE